MRPEYDFRGGVSGKHFKAYREGHTVIIHQEDGATVVQEFKLEENTVVLEPDVFQYFPDSESVNHALRMLISLVPEKRKAIKKARRVRGDKAKPTSTQNRSANS